MAENGGPAPELPDDDAPESPQRDTRLQRMLGDRPLSVFGVLLIGGAVLLLLLVVVVATSLNPNEPQRSTCLGIDLDDAEAAITNGQVRQVNIVTRQGDPETGPLAVTIDFNDQVCRRLPEGIAAQPDLYRIIGMITVYNQTFPGEQSIAIRWEGQPDIPTELLMRPTITPTPLPTVTPTAIPTATPAPSPTATATATAAASPTAAPTRTPVPSTPVATPRPTRVPASPTPIAPTPTAADPAASPSPAATPRAATPTDT
jgi:hypothetical protein